MERVVVEVARRGRLVVGEPYFTAGVPVVLESKGLGDLDAGRPRARPARDAAARDS